VLIALSAGWIGFGPSISGVSGVYVFCGLLLLTGAALFMRRPRGSV
jgi:hypothetical protein